jgi:hypothetical protein
LYPFVNPILSRASYIVTGAAVKCMSKRWPYIDLLILQAPVGELKGNNASNNVNAHAYNKHRTLK